MQVIKLFIYISCISFLSLSCNNSKEEKNNELKYDVIVGLIFTNSYIKINNDIVNQDNITQWINNSPYASEDFKAEYNRLLKEAYKNDPEMGLGFDSVLDAQDYPEEGLELESSDSKTGYMVFRGKSQKDFKLTVKMIMQNGKWLVDGCGIINIPVDKRQPR